MKKIRTYIGYLTFMLLFFIGFSSIAQTATDKILIKGKIIDAADKSSIIGASVIEKDKDDRTVTGVSTNIDGDFAIKISNPSNKLSVSYIGYKTQILSIGNRKIFNVSLVSSNNLNTVEIKGNVVVTNGNLSIDRRDNTHSDVTIQAKDLEELQASSIAEALIGRMPGVDIVASSGDPGAGFAIKIRGTSSINGATNPLIVVDGMPYETAIPTDFNFATADEQGYASLLSIAPSDIKDITVLKDAAATAVWGSRASNGVLIINTKRGAVSAPVVNYTFKGSKTAQPKAIPLLNGNQFSELIPEEYQNINGIPLPLSFVPEFQHDPANPYYYYNYSQNSDWLAAITRTGYTGDNNISISGGGVNARYYASVGYNNQTGTTLGTAYDRLNARLNLDYIVSTKIRFRTDIAYTHAITKGNILKNVRAIAQIKMPNQSIYEYDEYGHQTTNYFSPTTNIQGSYPNTYNPVALAQNGINNIYDDRVTPHFTIDYTLIPNLLRLNQDFQFDIATGRTASFLPQNATGRPVTETVVNRAYNFDSDSYSVYNKTNLTFTPNLGEKHSFLGLLSLQLTDTKSTSQSALTSNTASTFLQDPSAGSRIQNAELGIASTGDERRSIAALFQGQYKFLDRYIVAAALRLDGNSNFGPGQRYGLFPSISTRWRISGEPFMKKLTFVNDLSLKAGYGVAGNAPTRPYSFYNTYNNYSFTYLGQAGVSSANIGLDHLRFEKVIGKDLGLNLIVLNNRININIDVYQHTTKDLFFPNTIASFNGFTGLTLNVGTLDNQGYEINLVTTPLKSKNWIIDFNLNIAHNENVIREISPYVSTQTGNGTINGSYLSTLQLNNPLGSFYGYVYQGVYKDDAATIATDKNGNPIYLPNSTTPIHTVFNYPSIGYQFQAGDAKYQDINHDGVIDSRDIVYLGNGNPKVTGGFGPTITYKRNWKVNLFFSYRYGFSIINSTEMNTTNLYNFDNQSTAVLRRWQKPGDVTDIPRALYRTGYNWLGSSRYVEDGSFLRFSSATLRYNLDQLLAKKLGLKSASIYVTGQNLYTWTNYRGQDPEISARAGDIYQQPIDGSTTPAVKTYTLGLTASF